MNWFPTALIVVTCLLILTDLTKVSLSFVWLNFQVLGEVTMDEGIRSKNNLNLGKPMASQAIIQREVSN